MRKRNFEQWFSNFRESIADYKYYVDFDKVYKNIDNIKIELNILNSLVGSKDIEQDFINIIHKYPESLKCIPLLIAKREMEITATDKKGFRNYHFDQMNNEPYDYVYFMRETGLFGLLENKIINNLIDYVTGVEVGLDSNGRKNRGGHLMENLVEGYIIKAGYVRDKNYFKEMYRSEIEEKWDIDLSAISNDGKTEKRFDFVIKTSTTIYAIEVNFYTSSGSKLNETARSYKNLTLEAKNIPGFTFMWFTDGTKWKSAKNNLIETFDVMDSLYCIYDLENGVLENLR